jgi:hypothetical protein
LDTIRQVQFDGKPDQAFIQKILHSINTEEDNLSVGATPKPPVPAGRPIESISETEFHIRNFDEKLRVIVGGDDSVSNVTKIKGYVDAVRAALDQLCSRFVDNRPEDRDGGLDELRELAKAGEQLKDRLFEGPARASEVESLLAAPNGRRQCWFQLDHKTPVQIPWGLLFDRPPKHGRKLEPEELKRGFWCMKYDVCTLVSRSSRSSRPGIHSLEEPLHVTLTPSEILGVFNDAAVAHASDRGPQGWPKDSICYSTATLYDKARSIENILLYFFCNAKGDTLYLGSNSPAEVLKPSTFKQLMTQTKGQPRAFLFLNGCPTSGTAQAEWLSINGNVKFSGIIATEARVPTRFAWNFGRDLLRQFGDGKTAADALRDLRTLHWPLGLAYSLYSHTKRAAITLTGLKFPAPTAENFGALQNCPSYTLQK